MIKVAETARDEVNKLMKLDGFNPSKDFIRVGVKSGGCSGLSYEMKFDKLSGENDKVFENNGIKIAVDKKSFLYLVGTTLEYHGGLNGKGFVFNNPNANRTCGCGESFSLKVIKNGIHRRRIKKRVGKSRISIWFYNRY